MSEKPFSVEANPYSLITSETKSMIWNCLSPKIMAKVGVTYNFESTIASNEFHRSKIEDTSMILTLEKVI